MPLPTYQDYHKAFPGHDLNHVLITLRQIPVPKKVGKVRPNKKWRIKQAMEWDLKNPDLAEEAFEFAKTECQRIRAEKAAKNAKDTGASESSIDNKAGDSDEEMASDGDDGPADIEDDDEQEVDQEDDQEGVEAGHNLDYGNNLNDSPANDLGSSSISGFNNTLQGHGNMYGDGGHFPGTYSDNPLGKQSLPEHLKLSIKQSIRRIYKHKQELREERQEFNRLVFAAIVENHGEYWDRFRDGELVGYEEVQRLSHRNNGGDGDSGLSGSAQQPSQTELEKAEAEAGIDLFTNIRDEGD